MLNREAVARLSGRLAEEQLDGLLVLNPVNLRYLIGDHSNAYSRPLTLVLPAVGEPTFIVPRLEDLHARQLTGLADVRSFVEWPEGSRAGGGIEAEWQALLVEVLRERTLLGGRLGVERAFLGATREPGLR